MRKMVKILALVLVLTLAVGTFAACSLKTQKKQLVGIWVMPNSTLGYEFRDDGTVKFTLVGTGITIGDSELGTVEGKYFTEKEDGKNIVRVTYKVIANIEKVFEYKVEGDKLTMTDIDSGNVYEYSRG